MSAGKCIRGKGEQGIVDKKKANALGDLYDEQVEEAIAQGSVRPEQQAGFMALTTQQRRAATKKRARLQQMQAQDAILRRITESDDPEQAALATLSPDYNRFENQENLETLAESYRRFAHSHIVEFMDKAGSKAGGLDVLVPAVREGRRLSLRAMARESFGETTGDVDARAMARGVNAAHEYLRQLFNSMGGNIPKLDNWGLPQSHNRRLINAATKEEWVNFITPHLDRSRMIDFDTNAPFTEARLAEMLDRTYGRIVTMGMIDVQPGGFISRSITNRRAQERFLIFKNADSWLEYHERFGDDDIFNTVLGHINGMARDTALLKLYGPNPDATLRFIEAVVQQRKGAEALTLTGKKAAKAAGRITQGKAALRDVYRVVTGQIYQPENEGIANSLAALRNTVVSTMLGGAIFSGLADRAFARMVADLNGVSAWQTFMRQLSLWNPVNGADRRAAQRTGFINDLALGNAIGQARYFGEVVGPGWSRKLSDVVLRVGGLSPWTTWGRTGFGLEVLGHITEQMKRPFDKLDDMTKRSFEVYGITPEDWDLIRATETFRDPETGATILRPVDVIGSAIPNVRVKQIGNRWRIVDPQDSVIQTPRGNAIDGGGHLTEELANKQRTAIEQRSGGSKEFQRRRDAGTKLDGLIVQESELAIPQTSARTIALTTLGSQPGTFAGEVGRNVFLFKSFPITLLMTHVRRAVTGNFTKFEKAKYWAHLVIGTALLGALGEQMRQIADGKDPLPMDPTTEAGAKLWSKALLRGGGLGLMGDFVFSDVNRFGGGITESLAGPIVGTVAPSAIRLTLGNMREFVVEGKPKNFGREALRFAQLMTPGRSLWYLSLAFERLVIDEIQQLVDPNYKRSFRAMEQRAKNEYGTRFFSPPGTGFPPPRGPRMENVGR